MLWLLMSTSPMTFTLDFQGQNLKKSYLRNGMADWYGREGMWVDRMLHPLCESIGCYTHFVTYNVHFTHDLDLGFSRSNFENAVSQEWEGRLTWNERDLSRQNVGPMLWLSMFTSSMTLTLDFQGQIFNVHLFHDLDLGFSRSNFEKVVSQEWDGRLTWNERDVSR